MTQLVIECATSFDDGRATVRFSDCGEMLIGDAMESDRIVLANSEARQFYAWLGAALETFGKD